MDARDEARELYEQIQARLAATLVVDVQPCDPCHECGFIGLKSTVTPVLEWL